MTNDSVREELDGKISVAPRTPAAAEKKSKKMPIKSIEIADAPPPVAEEIKPPTTEIAAKPTSPTLVEFHSKNAAVPEWRLQLQNAVRQRQEQSRLEIEEMPRAQLVTSGANALKAEVVIEEPPPILHDNPDLNRALNRIEASRRKFLVEETPPTAQVSTPKSGKNFPFYIAPKTADGAAKPAKANPPIYSFAKPKLAPPPKIEPKKFDTNKLPPIPKPETTVENFDAPAEKTELKTETISEAKAETIETTIETKIETVETTIETKTENAPQAKIELIETVETKTIAVAAETKLNADAEEYDECPTFAMRFNAGLFDLIIGSFVSLLLLSPFILWSGNWISWAGFFGFAATCALVMFLYQTTTVGLYGKTFGMRLFSMELVDLAGEEYPTFHQAAVSSAVYLLSLAFAGAGFLTMLFNEDRRAVHDIVSGTIVVKEEV